MGIYEVKNKKLIEMLFCQWEETMIWSCLQNCMGSAYTDNLENPESAQIVIGDFCFFAGKEKEELVKHKPEDFKSDFIIMIPQNKKWADIVKKVYGDKVSYRERYAIKKEKDIFDKKKLKNIILQLGEYYKIKMIDEDAYNQIMKNKWAKDLCGNFKDYKDYKSHGIGVVVMKDGEIVSGASSYTFYNGGIEIEIDTREDYRRKGLASVCGAKLILECLKRGLYPSWDAQNRESVGLSEKLGYHFDKAYDAYEVFGY